jgi:hypothetical protein
VLPRSDDVAAAGGEAQTFRDVIGRFTTGVAIITSRHLDTDDGKDQADLAYASPGRSRTSSRRSTPRARPRAR